jgi:hypothetical protein
MKAWGLVGFIDVQKSLGHQIAPCEQQASVPAVLIPLLIDGKKFWN